MSTLVEAEIIPNIIEEANENDNARENYIMTTPEVHVVFEPITEEPEKEEDMTDPNASSGMYVLRDTPSRGINYKDLSASFSSPGQAIVLSEVQKRTLPNGPTESNDARKSPTFTKKLEQLESSTLSLTTPLSSGKRGRGRPPGSLNKSGTRKNRQLRRNLQLSERKSSEVHIPSSSFQPKRRHKASDFLSQSESDDEHSTSKKVVHPIKKVRKLEKFHHTTTQEPDNHCPELDELQENILSKSLVRIKHESTSMPLAVLQCKNCLKNITDTSYLHCLEASLYVFYKLTSNPNVITSEELMTQDDDSADDYLCTFSELFCSGCRHVLGRFYHSTPPRLQHLAGHPCIDRDAVMPFYIGLLDLKSKGSATSRKNGSSHHSSSPNSMPTLVSMQHDILRLQKMVLFLYGNQRKAAPSIVCQPNLF